ncbi:MAG: DUF4330 family protein [Halapricum sp.]
MPLSDDSSTGLIDDEGRLFGYVNVVDILVVLLVVAIGIAGVALLTSGSPAPAKTESTHATIDLGVQSSSVAAAISQGDSYEPQSGSNMTITDVYRVPQSNGQRTLVRVNLTGQATETGMTFAGKPPRLGRNLTISTDRYNASGDITAVGSSDSLAVENRTVVLRATLPSYRGDQFNAGQQIRLDDQTIATIQDVERYDVDGKDQTRLYLETALRVHAANGVTQFGGTLVQEGATIHLPGEGSLVPMTIERVGGFEHTSTTVRGTATVTSEEAQSMQEGDQFFVGDRAVATIDSLAIYDTNQADRKQVYANVTLQTVQIGDRPQFGSTFVRQGASVPFRTDDYELSLHIQRVGLGLDQSTTTALVSDTVTSAEAASITEGDTYLVGGQTVATVESAAIYDTGKPDRKQVFANVTLQTLQLGGQPQFGSTTVRSGASVPFRTDAYELNAQIQRVDQGLDQSSTQVLVSDTVSSEDAANITKGDQYVVAGHSIATVESVTSYGTNDPDQRTVYVGLTLDTLNYGELPQFGSTIVRQGAMIPFKTDEYELSGRVQRVGTTELPGTPITGNATIEIKNIKPSLADSIQSGMTDRSGGETIARITSVERDNATVILTSDSGQIYRREHPINQDVTITAELSLRRTAAGLRFKNRILQQGQTVRLDLGSLTVEGELVGPVRDT